MNYMKKIILSALCAAAIFSGMVVSATETSLPDGLLIGDQDGINVSKEGNYFISAAELKPGNVITKTLVIYNINGEGAFDLSMTVNPSKTSGPVNLLNEVNLNLKLDGREIYSGRVHGDEDVNMIQNALDLGEYKQGDRKNLAITLTVDKDMKRYYTKSKADFTWKFYAVRHETADPPKTGITVKFILYTAIMACLLLMYLLLVLKKYQKERNKVSIEHGTAL